VRHTLSHAHALCTSSVAREGTRRLELGSREFRHSRPGGTRAGRLARRGLTTAMSGYEQTARRGPTRRGAAWRQPLPRGVDAARGLTKERIQKEYEDDVGALRD